VSEGSKTVDKLLTVLIELGEDAFVSPQQMARRTETNRTVAQRLLTTLVARGYATKRDGEYSLSQRIALLADAVQRPLRRIVGPIVEDLAKATQETVVFQVLDGLDSVVLQENYWERSTSLQVRHEVGSRTRADITASGLAILARLPRDRVVKWGGGADLALRLDEVRATGFALTSGEAQQGVTGLATGVTAADGVVGSIAVLVPSTRADELSGYRGALERAARAITAGG
jgi:DNA-binding IclR family transcriptional regulator